MLMPISVFAVVTAQASIRYMVARQAYVISLITYNLAHGESGCDSYLLRLLDVRHTFVRPNYRSCSTLLVVIVLRLVGPLQEHIG